LCRDEWDGVPQGVVAGKQVDVGVQHGMERSFFSG
jgi:hypothetical protein